MRIERVSYFLDKMSRTIELPLQIATATTVAISLWRGLALAIATLGVWSIGGK